ncbi:MAG: AfsR/SARP family transcriptional regulator, partial [Actinocatenispora sp.]
MQHSPYFRLLGALDAEVAGVGIRLGSPQARAMLSLLLLRANGLCSLDQLVQDLWGETPPSSARAQVQNHVSLLRRTIECAGGDAAAVLVTRPPGYLLTVGPDQTDLMVFRRLVTSARAHRERGDLSTAVAEFRAALDLWRGAVLCDVTLPAVRDLAAPLDELRVDAVEDWAETALSAGAGEEVAAELGAAVAHYPLRERLRATLMRALAATGRTAEALEVYRTGRAVLVEELGIEPGAGLR